MRLQLGEKFTQIHSFATLGVCPSLNRIVRFITGRRGAAWGKVRAFVKRAIQVWQGRFSAFARQEDGPTATEYAILLAVLILGSMGVIQTIGLKFQAIYMAIASQIPNA